MATTGKKTFQTRKPENATHAMSIFSKRREARGVAWHEVDQQRLAHALSLAVSEDVAIMFSSASGGRGVCVKLYRGRGVPETEYASTAEELDDLLEMIIQALEPSTEDGSRVMAAD